MIIGEMALLTGEPPFDGPALPALCSAILRQQPTAIPELRPELRR